MPYKLRKAPNRELYWVVNKETGKKHSKDPLPKKRAQAQMRALYAVESGYTMRGGMEEERVMNIRESLEDILQNTRRYERRTAIRVGAMSDFTRNHNDIDVLLNNLVDNIEWIEEQVPQILNHPNEVTQSILITPINELQRQPENRETIENIFNLYNQVSETFENLQNTHQNFIQRYDELTNIEEPPLELERRPTYREIIEGAMDVINIRRPQMDDAYARVMRGRSIIDEALDDVLLIDLNNQFNENEESIIEVLNQVRNHANPDFHRILDLQPINSTQDEYQAVAPFLNEIFERVPALNEITSVFQDRVRELENPQIVDDTNTIVDENIEINDE